MPKQNEVDLMKIDLYGLLGIEVSSKETEIKKAYRKKALTCHPDKNPDNPKAAELFHQLSQALEILTDAEARKTYDNILKARAAVQLRNRELDAKRKKFKDDLESREQAAEIVKDTLKQDTRKLQVEIERLRKEGSLQLQEEQEAMRRELASKMELSTNIDSEEKSVKVKLSWKVEKDDPDNGGYNLDNLEKIMSKYGNVTIAISKKKSGKAIIEFEKLREAKRACAYERGLSNNVLNLEIIGQKNIENVDNTKPTVPFSSSKQSSSFDEFESLVMRNLRQANERQKLIEQMKKEDAEEIS